MESVEREVRWLVELIDAERRTPPTPAPSRRCPGARPPDASTRPTPSPVHPQHFRRRKPWVPSESRSSASATAPPRSSRASSTTGRRPDRAVPGLMHVEFGEYHVRDIEFVAAFDVDAKKVGKDLSEAIGASENNTIKIADVPTHGRHRAARPDARRPRQVLPRDDRRVRRRAGRHRRAPSGTPRPTCSSATCRWAPRRPTSSTPSAPSTPASASSTRLPVFIASRPGVGREVRGRRRADHRRRHQVARSAPPSPTACWPSCSRTAACVLDRTYQLNVGGNMDFMNMLERDRLESKKISKTQAVTSNHRPRPRRDATSTSARRTTCRGSTTASGPTSASRVAPSATCR